jgi:hypothetical protein
MNIHSNIKMHSVIRHMVQAMEILNEIPEEDYVEFVAFARREFVYMKGVNDNIERGNLFMAIFFLREILESVASK